ncbi:glycosyltransferase family 2 protein [Accumulibacter sp.]|uniref:glycosyltransferase family 2 protein n=1 Tax=Accumulibacter sp. TaxID=2053492 RepID=UPI0025FC3F1A|nr:glycosyltransferase family 2 protein [Accumulibacter sp.]MCM8614005.1 glycosyltransferase family 2 protein [Accumulibacter sp.]MCM8637732.1 glycosyltransferase family 2 protein [Accumulibacter sp.]MCM8638857.1 glycosyltransferase family 2 protein [Accumulibacter sp.]
MPTPLHALIQGPPQPIVEAPRPQISIVSTLYRSRPFLEDFLDGCLEALRRLAISDFEIVLVNDGSPDDSLDYLLARRHDLAELVVVDLSRNFGHHHAMQAGLRQARGDLVFLIDCDLEVSPLSLCSFHDKLRETGCDIVFGYQERRKGGWFERISGGLFWKGFNLLSETRIPENIVTERLMNRRFVDALLQLGDHNLFLGGMMSWTGFHQIGIAVGKSQREGASTYTLLKRVSLMVNAVSSFSAQPLVWLFNFGALVTAVSFSYVIYLMIRKLLFGDALIGFTSVMGLMALSLGILTMAIGLVGVYLGKVFTQVQNRPNYIVKDIHR